MLDFQAEAKVANRPKVAEGVIRGWLLYIGWFLIFWATPQMSVGHLLLAIGMSAYILIAIRYEERDLVAFYGEDYINYQRKVPMLIPRPGKVHETVKSRPTEPLQTT